MNIDMIDETPLLDLRPNVARFNDQLDMRIAWLDMATDNIRNERVDS